MEPDADAHGFCPPPGSREPGPIAAACSVSDGPGNGSRYLPSTDEARVEPHSAPSFEGTARFGKHDRQAGRGLRRVRMRVRPAERVADARPALNARSFVCGYSQTDPHVCCREPPPRATRHRGAVCDCTRSGGRRKRIVARVMVDTFRRRTRAFMAPGCGRGRQLARHRCVPGGTCATVHSRPAVNLLAAIQQCKWRNRPRVSPRRGRRLRASCVLGAQRPVQPRDGRLLRQHVPCRRVRR